jgi:acetyl-CoA acyltransferase
VAELIQRTEIDGKLVEAIVYGTVVPVGRRAEHRARGVAPPDAPEGRAVVHGQPRLRLGQPGDHRRGDQIALGHADVIIAGGAESLSNVPILHSRGMSEALVAASRAKRSAGA